MNYKKIAENIQFLCKKKGMHIGCFEKSVGLAVGYLSRIKLNHTKGFSLEKAYRISKELGVSIEELVERDFVKEDWLERLKKQREKIDAEIMSIELEGEKL